MEYYTVAEMSEKWGISKRRIQVLIKDGRIPGVIHKGNMYLIPEEAKKPGDKRKEPLSKEAEFLAYKARAKRLWKDDPKVII